MALQYWVGDFFVDVSRNQITRNQQSQTIPPKALAVLTFLAKRHRKVVSHDELLAQVWSDTVVTPNTLQRSIAQLRKALGEDRKAQSYIITHTKQGYSLECEVVWESGSDSKDGSARQKTAVSLALRDAQKSQNIEGRGPQSEDRRSNRHLLIAIIGLALFGFIGFKLNAPRQNSQFAFDRLQSVTATDHKEFNPTYSPNGQYILFQRYLDKLCFNRIWARNTSTQKEFQLTRDWGTYGRHALSPDGKTLVFIAAQDCTKPVAQGVCYDLVSLDFQKAIESPQPTDVLIHCKNSKIKYPVWLNDDNIAVFQASFDHWQLINYSVSDNTSHILYDLEDGNLVYFDYSISEGLIAIISTHQDGRFYLDMLYPDGQVLSSHPVDYPDEIPEYKTIYPNFSPLQEQLIFSTGRRLFSLSYDGKVNKIDLPLDQPVGSPSFHPDGQKALLIKGRHDSDIASIPLSESGLATAQVTADVTDIYPSIMRSILGEDNGVFQPKGNMIAFSSERSGEDQVWVADGEDLRQISQFPMDTRIYGLDWSADGRSVLVNANKKLTQVFLDGRKKDFFLAYPVAHLFQWDSENNTALLSMTIRGRTKLAEVDLHALQVAVINQKQINWAQRSGDGRLIYMDHMNRFWQPGPVEDQLIEKLAIQGSEKRFVVQDEIIYAINQDNQLWSYNLDTGDFNLIRGIHQDVFRLTDVRQTNLLMTYVVSEKKEVAELYLRQ